MKIYYTRRYPVPVLRSLLRKWQQEETFHEFRGRIVDAIDGHSERDRVSPRLDNDRQVKVFEHVAAHTKEDR